MTINQWLCSIHSIYLLCLYVKLSDSCCTINLIDLIDLILVTAFTLSTKESCQCYTPTLNHTVWLTLIFDYSKRQICRWNSISSNMFVVFLLKYLPLIKIFSLHNRARLDTAIVTFHLKFTYLKQTTPGQRWIQLTSRLAYRSFHFSVDWVKGEL